MEQYHRPLRIVAVGAVNAIRAREQMPVRTSSLIDGQYPTRSLTRFPKAPTVSRAQFVKVEQAEPCPKAGVALDITPSNV
jgi:hypothetical protein